MPTAPNLTWVLETEVFPDCHEALAEAAKAAGQDVVPWDDLWWSSDAWPRFADRPVVFHGSLGNADRVRSSLSWTPGAYCNTEAFCCSNWYPQVSDDLLNRRHLFTTVRRLCEDPAGHFESLNCDDTVFVRPDSALKPFSGRVLGREQITPKALDHGFYYDDLDLPILLAPLQPVRLEWRLVMLDQQAIAGSRYEAESRSARDTGVPEEVRRHAEELARRIDVGDRVYVMDICRIDDGLRLLELNPFSGADLYHCDRHRIVEALGRITKPNDES